MRRPEVEILDPDVDDPHGVIASDPRVPSC
jgi:hypothetical protein